VVIPNRRVIESTLVNHSKHGGIRVDVPLAIAPGERVTAARKVLLDAAAEVDGVVATPEADVVVRGLSAAGVDLLVRVWIDDAALERPVFYRVTEACKEALEGAGVQIPSPQIQLLLDQTATRLEPPPPRRREDEEDDET
jgi:small-conductance mechanosensitive channel